MSTVMDTIFPASGSSSERSVIGIRQGDWNNYLAQIAAPGEQTGLPEDPIERLTYKRRCALAYLGKRAQLYGGLCSKTTPRILTPEMISELSEANRAKRYKRYPWIERLLNLMAEIELVQAQSISQANVFSLVHSRDAFDNLPPAHSVGLDDRSGANTSRKPS